MSKQEQILHLCVGLRREWNFLGETDLGLRRDPMSEISISGRDLIAYESFIEK